MPMGLNVEKAGPIVDGAGVNVCNPSPTLDIFVIRRSFQVIPRLAQVMFILVYI